MVQLCFFCAQVTAHQKHPKREKANRKQWRKKNVQKTEYVKMRQIGYQQTAIHGNSDLVIGTAPSALTRNTPSNRCGVVGSADW